MNDKSLVARKRPLTQPNVVSDKTKKRRLSGEDDIELKSRPGTIKHIILKNFMCHSFFEVNFTNSSTVIVGRNGSGKSAILTGLIVGLGGKAALTNRGKNVKGFVKIGKPSGSVEIQLNNEGPLAYNPNTYGKHITIIRTFSANGNSSYKIKDETGAIVSTQAKEIRNLTNSLNIQIDNPICILNQDTSRNFLNSSNPTHKFSLFMRATGLEKLKEKYNEIEANKVNCLKVFEQKQKDSDSLQNEISSLKIKIDNYKSIVTIQEKIQLDQIELLWAKTRDLEIEIKEDETKVDKCKETLENFKNLKENRLNEMERYRSNIEELKTKIKELKSSLETQIRPQQVEARRIIDRLYTECNLKKSSKQTILIEMEARNREVSQLEQEISNINQTLSVVEKEKQERLQALTNKENKIKQLEDVLQTYRNELYQYRSDSSMKEETRDSLSREINAVNQKIRERTHMLQTLKNETGRSLLVYGEHMPKIMKMIEQYKDRFTHPPRGPLGYYIKLKDKAWDVAVESFFGSGLLTAFAVDNKKDNELLSEIFDKTLGSARRPMIITSKFIFKVHDIRRNLVQSLDDCPSLYSVLQVEDPVVTNCLIDQAEIECVLLFPDTRLAMEIMSQASKVPKNCKQGVTIKGDKFYPDPEYRFYASMYHRAKFLQTDTKEYTKQLEEDIRSFTQKKEELVIKHKEIHNEIEEQERIKSKYEEKIKKLSTARLQLGREIDEIRLTAEPRAISLIDLEEDLTKAKSLLQKKKLASEKVDSEINEIKGKITKYKEQLSKLEESSSELDTRINDLEYDLRENVGKLRTLQTNEEFEKTQVETCQQELSEILEVLNKKNMDYQEKVKEASTIGDRPEDIRQMHEIIREMQALERTVKRLQFESEDLGDVKSKYKELRSKYDKISEIMAILGENIEELNKASVVRNRHYKLTEKYFVSFVKHSFKNTMGLRQFDASIDINIEASELILHVAPQNNSQIETKSSNLSGGERSFTTVAFLHALWQCMDFPFYFLDEFDVFMDKMNRSKAFDVLLQNAETHSKSQFVFLTPQDISFIRKDVTILKLANPERTAKE